MHLTKIYIKQKDKQNIIHKMYSLSISLFIKGFTCSQFPIHCFMFYLYTIYFQYLVFKEITDVWLNGLGLKIHVWNNRLHFHYCIQQFCVSFFTSKNISTESEQATLLSDVQIPSDSDSVSLSILSFNSSVAGKSQSVSVISCWNIFKVRDYLKCLPHW